MGSLASPHTVPSRHRLLDAGKVDWGFTAFALAGFSSMVFIGIAALRTSRREAAVRRGDKDLIAAH
ncbi:hypothetical protein [Streptomyces sp. SID5789]|uniref:hypothetical protein n=1 Tax=Streptomyces sp. SID5789 TaxID=2690310 RepID=UPI001F40E54A|nr:hypothetical protein [Streptomyces sp. SID5789]